MKIFELLWGLKPGIVSAIAMSPDNSHFAAGNLTPATEVPIVLYDASSDVSDPIMSLGINGNFGGISQVVFQCPIAVDFLWFGHQICFDSWRPHILYASFRKDSRIYAWDLRSGLRNDAPYRVYGVSPPSSDHRTNQRIRFDVDAGGKLLATGSRVRRGSFYVMRRFHVFYRMAPFLFSICIVKRAPRNFITAIPK